MALPDYARPSVLTQVSTGITNQAIANAAEYISTTVIDNTTARQQYLAVEVVWSYATAPTADKTVELRVVESLDGTNFEDTSRVIAAWSPPADTATHRRKLLSFFSLTASKYKLAVKNVDTEQTITVTVNAWTHTDTQEDN